MLTTLQEKLQAALDSAKGLSVQVESLLKEGKTFEDDDVKDLSQKRLAAYEDVDTFTAQVVEEGVRLQSESGAIQALETYQRVGFVAPKTAPDYLQERINKIVTPQLRKMAIAQPLLASDQYRESVSQYVKQSLAQNHGLPIERFLTEFGGGAEHYTMETVTDDLGGLTVPVDVQDEVLRALGTFATMRQICGVIPTSSNLVEWLTVKRASGAGSKSIFTGTFVGGMVTDVPGAGDAVADAKFEKLDIPVRKSRVLGWFTSDLARDAAVDILGLLQDEGAQNLAIVEDKQFLLGTGANGEVLGLLNHPSAASPGDTEIKVRDISGTTADTLSNLTTDRGSEAKILALIDDIPAQYRVGSGVAMIGKATVRTSIRGLVSPGGDFLWRDELAAAITNGGRAGSVDGVPFYINDQMAAEGTDANKVLVVGNFRYYRIVDRQRMSVAVSVDERFSREQVGVRLNTRFGGHGTNPEAFAFGRV